MAESYTDMNGGDGSSNLFTDGNTAEILAAIPTLSVPPALAASNNTDLLQKRVVIIGGSIGGLATAACLRAAGFCNVQIVEKSTQQGRGAGIGLDDASIGILKGLGLNLGPSSSCDDHDDDESGEERKETTTVPVPDIIVQRMRWIEERIVKESSSSSSSYSNGSSQPKILDRQSYPYSAVRYSELIEGLETVATVVSPPYMTKREGMTKGIKAVKIEEIKEEDGEAATLVRVYLQDVTTDEETTMDCDLVVIADGPRSQFRNSQIISANMDDGTTKNHNNETENEDEEDEGKDAEENDKEDDNKDEDKDEDDDDAEDDLRFAGYTAWRGTIPEKNLPTSVQSDLRETYPQYSNCIYFLWGPPGKSGVLYDIGNGLVNWLVYECCDEPKAAQLGRTTTTSVEANEIETLKQNAIMEWGSALGCIIQCTPEPFQTDIYDITTPLTSFVNVSGNICIVGDAAHPITPHAVKGSNMAIQDAYCLAWAAANSSSIAEMTQSYNQMRLMDCHNKVLMSRHLGRMRNGMSPLAPDGKPYMGSNGKPVTEEGLPRPPDSETFLLDVVALSGGIPTFTLPTTTTTIEEGNNDSESKDVFAPTWEFMRQHIPPNKRGFWLQQEKKLHTTNGIHHHNTLMTGNGNTVNAAPNDATATTTTLPSLEVVDVNHISLETHDVDRLVSFYQNVLGLPTLPRPNFGFGGSWLSLPGGQALHIIERDPEKPETTTTTTTITNGDKEDDTKSPVVVPPPERFIRRSRHVALTVLDVEAAKSILKAHDITFATFRVPDTTIEQLFFYDPDGNGIEIGNFNASNESSPTNQ